MSLSVQAQWSIDQTSQSVVGVTRGLLKAATTDNVQVLAILACESFGATLAICPETCRRIERYVVPTPEPAVLHFIKVTVGYATNDCVSQLSTSLAGIQFLGLAAALVTTMDHFQAAVTVQAMLVDTATDKTMVPTVRQVQDLLNAIDAKCVRSGFANEVVGWQLLLGQSRDSDSSLTLPRLPAQKGIESLVNAFRQLGRVGNADVQAITIRTTFEGAAWALAFIKWCLGFPPTIMFENGKHLMQQEGSKVNIRVLQDSNQDSTPFRVTVHSLHADPSELVESKLGSQLLGMISGPTYMSMLLQQAGLKNNMTEQDLHQAMPYILNDVLTKLVFVDNHIVAQSERRKKGSLNLRLSPFPQRTVLSKAYGLLFNRSENIDLQSLDKGIIAAGPPLLTLYLDGVKCQCHKCIRRPKMDYERCSKDLASEAICNIVAFVLGFSLFQSPDALLVSSSFFYSTHDNLLKKEFTYAIFEILSSSTYRGCTISSLHAWSLELVGHREASLDAKSSPYILSSSKGQAVWATIHQTKTVTKCGYLSLSWLPGQLIYQGESYKGVCNPQDSSKTRNRYNDLLTTLYPGPSTQALNFHSPDLRLRWLINLRDCDILDACICLSKPDKIPSFIGSTVTLFQILTCAVLVESCGHKPDAELSPGRRAKIVPTMSLLTGQNHESSIVPVDGNDEFSYFALACAPWTPGLLHKVVLRKASCLECCLKESKRD